MPVAQELDIRIASIEGGNMRNAIPREAFAIVTLPAIHVDKFQNRIKEYETIFKAELSAKEPTLQLFAEEVSMPGNVMNAQFKLISSTRSWLVRMEP